MVQKSQDNIKLQPETCSIFPSNLRYIINERYTKLMSQGSLKEEKQIQEDKARALGYAILNRYEREDVATKERIFDDDEYEKMFGMDPEEMGDFVKQMERIEPKETEEDKKKAQPP